MLVNMDLDAITHVKLPLHEIIMACQNNRDKALINLFVLIDFKKAFDMVDPKLLLIMGLAIMQPSSYLIIFQTEKCK
jgi:hypothetical protein